MWRLLARCLARVAVAHALVFYVVDDDVVVMLDDVVVGKVERGMGRCCCFHPEDAACRHAAWCVVATMDPACCVVEALK